ncbi:hypothetical protein BN85308860 [Paracholeplasma brassicae]|uniref:Uncharacterized protein n=1 Tax=Acholeplasma brassicae TaxID=61635 RepID=U4KNI3_9MOLU|nr:hypothetical protein [Paracholeplasma brassicae]CCV65907.1 hypothetical protein BN85308860 [Paracholeplasma brassicae]
MIEWLKSLTPEFYVTIGGLVLLSLFSIIQLYRLNRISNKVGEQEFYMKEMIQMIDGLTYLHLTVINKSFSSNQINMISIARRNISKTIEEKTIMIAPRSKYNTNFLMDDLKPFVFSNRKSYKKFKIYVENEIGLRKAIKPKYANKYLKKEFNKEKHQMKLELKAKRFEQGTYNLAERIGLIVGLLFRPFKKMFQNMAYSTNKALKESEIRRQQKKEHDAIKYKLEETEAQLNSIRIQEDALKVNKTRETELQLLKKEKELALEKIKLIAIQEAYEQAKTDVIKRNVEEEAKSFFQENPIKFDELTEQAQLEIDKNFENNSLVSTNDVEETAFTEDDEKIEKNKDIELEKSELEDQIQKNDEKIEETDVSAINGSGKPEKRAKKSKKEKNIPSLDESTSDQLSVE